MQGSEPLSTIIAIIGAVTGILGFITATIAIVQTRKANKLSQDANTLAEKANGIAKKSIAIASKANGLATEANKISSDANTISKRALSVTADQTVYAWGFKFDKQTSTIYMTNNSPNTAHDVTVIVRNDDKTIIESHVKEMAPFSDLPLQNQLLSDKVSEDQRNIDRINASDDGLMFIAVGKVTVDIDLVWTSDLGLKRSEKFKKSFS